jgi:hypothetical protein
MEEKATEPIGKQQGGDLQPVHDPKHPGQFMVEIPGHKTIRGKYSSIVKAIRKYEGV